ncbi:MAG: hypothetical protein QF561_02885 [Phycisphaerales bacterium]|nr:hypothetical protein [Phycisphaerales bacterium]
MVATGHQPLPPHPGILAKYLAARQLADAAGGVVLNLVVDTVDISLGDVEVPVGSPPLGLVTRRVSLAREAVGVLATRPAAVVAACSPPPEVSPDVRRGLMAISRAWESAGGQTAGVQAAECVAALLQPYAGDLISVAASALVRTPAGEALVRAMKRDPQGCARAWNAACCAVPEARVRLLRVGAEPELPLWVLDRGLRRPAGVDDLDSPESLLPSGLVTTAIIRSAGCDAFVHGLGGWRYDQVMERWIAKWLGWPLAACWLATAEARLPGCDEAAVLRAETVQRRRRRRVRHDPAGGGKAGLSAEKAALLKAIDQSPPRSVQRRDAWNTLHRWLDRSSGVRDSGVGLATARKRDWAFPLYPEASMRRMEAAIARAISEDAALPCPMPC